MAAPVNSPDQKSKSYILPVAIFLFGIVLCIAIVFQVLIYTQNAQVEKLDQDIASVQKELSAMTTTELQAYLETKKILDAGFGKRAAFSLVLERLIKVLQPTGVLVSSLSIDNQNKLTVNLIAPDYLTVNRVLEQVKKDDLFVAVFVPNITTGFSADRTSVVNFPIIIDLSAGKIPLQNTPKPTTGSGAVGIPRPTSVPASPSPTFSVTATPSARPTPETPASPEIEDSEIPNL